MMLFGANLELVFAGMEGIAAALGTLLVFGTLIYLSRQVKAQTVQVTAQKEIIEYQVYQQVTNQMQEINKLLFDNPGIRPYLYDAKPPPTSGDARQQVEALAEMFFDFAACVVMQKGAIQDNLYLVWHDYFRTTYRQSPALRNYWAERRGDYGVELASVIEDGSPHTQGPVGGGV